MLAAICFGSVFGLPIIAWGVILIVDRDRTWQRKIQRSSDASPPRRSEAWDRRQIFYGSLLVVFGATVLLLFSIFNYLAGAVSPPAPF